MPMAEVWPWARWFCFCCVKRKKDFKAAVRIGLRHKLNLPIRPKDKETYEDRLQLLGHGVNAYYKFIKAIWFLCLVLLIFNLPLFFIFSDYDIYTKMDMPMAALTVGNMGGAITICDQIPHHMTTKTLRLKCPTGKLNPFALSHDGDEILEIGLMDSKQPDVSACTHKVFTDPYDCSQYLKTDEIIKSIKKNAAGLVEYDLHEINTPEFNIKPATDELDQICHGPGSMLFVQIGCDYTIEDLQERRVKALYIGCSTIVCALFLIVYTDYLDKMFKNWRTLYDVETVSAADYTVDFKISHDFWSHFVTT